MINYSEILAEIIRIKGLKNLNELSKKLGYKSPEKLGRLVREPDAKPSIDTLQDFLSLYPDLNPTWLLTGQGSPLLEGENTAIPRRIAPHDVTTAPLISQYAYGGYMRGYGDAGFMEAQPLYVASKKYSGGNYVAFEVRGDSMDDNTRRAICSGDVVLGRELYREYWTSKLHIPRVFIIVHKTEGICIKEVTAHNVQKGIITCHSFNPDYDDFEVDLKEVMQLFYLKEIKREAENGY